MVLSLWLKTFPKIWLVLLMQQTLRLENKRREMYAFKVLSAVTVAHWTISHSSQSTKLTPEMTSLLQEVN